MSSAESDVRSQYRTRVRAWLATNTEPRKQETGFATRFWMHDPDADHAHYERGRELRRRLCEAGYLGITLPVELGGQGGEPWMERVFAEESASRNIDMGFLEAIAAMAIPAFRRFGTDEQQRRFIPGMLSGATTWCQLFSEPGAGSDLASLGCRAELDGDEFVINGQKVWNSQAIHADMGLLLVRTDPAVVKHAGITFLLLDMHQPGVEVRRLIQANGSGHFCEVFLTDARCPTSHVLGDVNNGWAPARTVMASESTTIGAAPVDFVARLMDLARRMDRNADPAIRQRLAALHTEQRVLRLTGQRMAHAMRTGAETSIDPSILKVSASHQRIHEGDLAMDLLGSAGTAVSHEASEWAMDLLHMRFGMTIGGGTDEVHRNNIAERALGLPKEPRVDRDTPWNDARRGS
jgi:acyl-CoA dehydrogenase